MVDDLRLMIALRFLHGMLFGVNQTTTSTMVALLLPEDRMTSGIGMFTLGMVVSMGIAPGVGIWVMESYGYTMFFLVAGVITSVAFLFTFFVARQPTLPPKIRARQRGVAGFFAREAAVPATVILLNASGFGVVSTFLILHGEARNIQNVGVFFTAFSMALLVSRLVAGRYADRLPARHILYPCSVLLCVAMVLLWSAQSLAYLIAAAVAHGICNGFAQPILQTMALLSVEPERRGVANGTYFMGVDLGNGIAPVVAGIVASFYGYGASFLFVLIPVTIGIFVLFFTGRRANAAAHAD
jgi:MFS family permease